MIITLSGANFSSSNIGNLGNSGPFDVTVSCSNVSGASVSLNGGGKSASGTGSAKLTGVPSGTSVTYTISASGYNTASGTINVSFSNVTRSISLTAVGSVTPPVNPDQPGTGGGSGETPSNLLSLGTLHEKTVTTSTTDTTLKTDSNYFTYADVPVNPNTKYISVGARRVFFLNSSKTALSASINANNNNPQGSFTTPNNCVYVIISYKYEDLQPSEAVMTLN